MYNYESQYNTYLDTFNKYLENYLKSFETDPPVLKESMAYSLLAGGKRIRPVLMLAVADMLHVSLSRVLPYALALEMIHTYSLIHDDLPAMDNDDFRRGKPSSHKKFGEGNAILAGDALLNEAFSLLFSVASDEKYGIKAGKLLADFAGKDGMILGQSADLKFTNGQFPLTETSLKHIYEHKTGKLLLAAVLIPSILENEKHYSSLCSFGVALGYLFQFTDDVLDVEGSFQSLGKTIGKDEQENKLTAVKLYGLEKTKSLCDEYEKLCLSALNETNENVPFLADLTSFIRSRKN